MGENVSTALTEQSLYEKFSSRVYYVALRGCGSPQDAEDVRSETFVRVLQAMRTGQVRAADALPGFVLGVTRNVLHELYAKRRRAGSADGSAAPEPAVPSHESAWLTAEVRAAVRQTIDQMKPREKTVLRLIFYDELPTPEVARRIGIAPERVRLVKSRALQRFRQLLTTAADTAASDSSLTKSRRR